MSQASILRRLARRRSKAGMPARTAGRLRRDSADARFAGLPDGVRQAILGGFELNPKVAEAVYALNAARPTASYGATRI